HHGSLGKTHQVALDGAAHFQRPAKGQQVPIDDAFHAHNFAGREKGVVYSFVRRYRDDFTVTLLQGKARQRQRKQYDQQAQTRLAASSGSSCRRSLRTRFPARNASNSCPQRRQVARWSRSRRASSTAGSPSTKIETICSE